MIRDFVFSPFPALIFGNGCFNKLAGHISTFGKNILVLTGNGSLQKSGRLDRLLISLKNNNQSPYTAKVVSEPSPEMIDDIRAAFSDKNIDCVLGIGGGSVLDAGKAVSAMLMMDGSVKDYLEGVGTKKPDGKKIPYIAVPTTSGTGSEATKNAVISKVGEKGFKKSLRHDNYIPNLAVIDPGLMLDCPPWLTATAGMDAFTQLLESYLSVTSDVISESLAPEAFRCIARSLQIAVDNGKDIEARADLAYAAFISGVTIANAGLGTVHGFASSLGGFFNIPHGVVCGKLMAPANKMNIKRLIADNNVTYLEKYQKVSQIFVPDGHDKIHTLNKFIDYLFELSEKLDIPGFSTYGVTHRHIDKIVAATDCKNNPVKHSEVELKEILAACL